MGQYILAIDQGTTSSRAILFDRDMSVVALAQSEFPQHFPASGWVEHEAEDLWSTTLETCRKALKQAGAEALVAACCCVSAENSPAPVLSRQTAAKEGTDT